MKQGIVSVNDAKAAVLKNGSLISSVPSSSVYEGQYCHAARKKEVNIKIITTDNGDMLLRNVPLFDKSDLQEMRNQIGEFKYIHIGCISVALEPLIHQKYLQDYGSGIRGVCVIFDSTFEVFEESIISAHKFDLSKRRADFICYPDHCLSASDENLLDRISVLICMDNIKVRKGNEMMTMCIGHVTTGTNTLNVNGSSPNLRSVSVTGTEEVEATKMEDKVKEALSSTTTKCCSIIPTEEDTYIQPKRNKLMSMFLRPPKVVLRKNYAASEDGMTDFVLPKVKLWNDSFYKNHRGLEPGRMSFSAPNSPSGQTSSDISEDHQSLNRLYVDGDAVKDSMRKKKQLMIAHSRCDTKSFSGRRP